MDQGQGLVVRGSAASNQPKLPAKGKKAFARTGQRQFAFIDNTSLSLRDPEVRRSIRAQARRKRRPERVEDSSWLASVLDDGEADPGAGQQRSLTHLEVPAAEPQIEQTLGHAFSFLTFPVGEVKPYMRFLIQHFFTTVAEAMYPLEHCLRMTTAGNIFFHLVSTDIAYFHSALFSSSCCMRLFLGNSGAKDETANAAWHLDQTIRLVNERLADTNAAISDANIGVVTGLTLTEALMENYSSAAVHMNGLQRMVELRGGLMVFKDSRHLLYKICRADITHAIATSSAPRFLRDDITWDAFVPQLGPDSTPAPKDALQEIIAPFDTRFVNIVRDVHGITYAINLAHSTSHKLDPLLFQELVVSIQYRLLWLPFIDDVWRPGDPIEEAFQLGILAYLSTLFLQFPKGLISWTALLQHLKTSLESLRMKDESAATENFLLWLYFLGWAVGGPYNRAWFLEGFRDLSMELKLKSWGQAKAAMKTFFWIDDIHDGCCEGLWKAMTVSEEGRSLGL